MPRGWTGPNDLILEHNVTGLPTLKTGGSNSVTASSPRIRMTGDFFVEIETYFTSGDLNLTLVGDDGPNLEAKFGFDSRGATVASCTLPGRRQHDYRVGSPEDAGGTLIRLERRDEVYTVLFNSDESSRVDYRYEEYGDFKGLELFFGHSNIHVYDVRVGPLKEPAPARRGTTAYVPQIPNNSAPEGWQVIGQALNGKVHYLSPQDKIRLDGDFELRLHARFNGFALYTITLLGADGGRSLPIHFSHDVKVAHVVHTSFPQVDSRMHHVQAGNLFEIRLTRTKGNFEFSVYDPDSRYARSTSQVLRDGGFESFDGLKIDVWSPSFVIEQLEIKPIH